jgi:hypothetical protein
MSAYRIIVEPRRDPLNPQLESNFRSGSMPGDGTSFSPSAVGCPRGLLVSQLQRDAVVRDEIAAKYLRRFVGSAELIHGTPRWCIWMPKLVSADSDGSIELRTRFAHVRRYRLNSVDNSLRNAAHWPHSFARIKQLSRRYLCVPRCFSRDRPYIIADYLDPTVIAGDATQITEDPNGLVFAVLSSSMFMTWQRAVGGQVHADQRFGVTRVWNTFPLPHLSTVSFQRIVAAGSAVVAARTQLSDRRLAELYDPIDMDPVLRRAHDALDTAIDTAFGVSRRTATTADRLDLLLRAYEDGLLRW